MKCKPFGQDSQSELDIHRKGCAKHSTSLVVHATYGHVSHTRNLYVDDASTDAYHVMDTMWHTLSSSTACNASTTPEDKWAAVYDELRFNQSLARPKRSNEEPRESSHPCRAHPVCCGCPRPHPHWPLPPVPDLTAVFAATAVAAAVDILSLSTSSSVTSAATRLLVVRSVVGFEALCWRAGQSDYGFR